jgi:hypothetical protein
MEPSVRLQLVSWPACILDAFLKVQESPRGVPFWVGSIPREHTIGYRSWGTSNDESVVTIWGRDNQEVMSRSYVVHGHHALALRQDQLIEIQEFPQERIGGLLELVHGAEEISFSLVQEKDMVGQPFGKAHVMRDHDAGKAKLVF